MRHVAWFFLSLGFLACSEESSTPSGGAGSGGAAGGAGAPASSSATGGTGGASGASSSGGAGGTSGAGAGGGTTLDAGTDGADSSDGPSSDGEGGSACPDEGTAKFPDAFRDSVWLIGWSGGLNHYSWVRFNFLSPTGLNGTASVLDASGVGTTPYFPCQGNDGLFSADPTLRQIVLQLPQSCADAGVIDAVLRVICFDSVHLVRGSSLAASIDERARPLEGHRFPKDYCGANFTSCPAFP
jgi:hypothetical protein